MAEKQMLLCMGVHYDSSTFKFLCENSDIFVIFGSDPNYHKRVVLKI